MPVPDPFSEESTVDFLEAPEPPGQENENFSAAARREKFLGGGPEQNSGNRLREVKNMPSFMILRDFFQASPILSQQATLIEKQGSLQSGAVMEQLTTEKKPVGFGEVSLESIMAIEAISAGRATDASPVVAKLVQSAKEQGVEILMAPGKQDANFYLSLGSVNPEGTLDKVHALLTMEQGFTQGMYGLQFEPLQLFTSSQGVDVANPSEIKEPFVKKAFAEIDGEQTTSYLQNPEVY